MINKRIKAGTKVLVANQWRVVAGVSIDRATCFVVGLGDIRMINIIKFKNVKVKSLEEKIETQNKKLIDFDKETDEIYYDLSRVCIHTAQEAKNNRRVPREKLLAKVQKQIDKINRESL